MSSHHNTTLNFSHAPYKNKSDKFISNIDLEIKRGELRLSYIQLMREFHTYLDEKDAKDLIKESVTIWERLNIQK